MKALLWISRGWVTAWMLGEWYLLVSSTDYEVFLHLFATLFALYLSAWWWSDWRNVEALP
jgi:hypothetical protein